MKRPGLRAAGVGGLLLVAAIGVFRTAQLLLTRDRADIATLSLLGDAYTAGSGFSAAARSYFLTGDVSIADAAIDQALRMGTRDAALHFHAGEIKLAAGNPKAAREHFAAALDITHIFILLMPKPRGSGSSC